MVRGRRTSTRKVKDRTGLIIVIAIITMVAGVCLLVKYRDRLFPPVVPPERVVKPTVKTVTLYFSNERGLNGEKREIKRGDLTAEIKEVLKALIQGPTGNLTVTIPKGTTLLNAELKDGIAYVDFSKEISEKHPGGSSAELQTIYSIVNTLTLNFAEVKKVQILVGGKKVKTLAGHIDITFPLGADRGLIKG